LRPERKKGEAPISFRRYWTIRGCARVLSRKEGRFGEKAVREMSGTFLGPNFLGKKSAARNLSPRLLEMGKGAEKKGN